MRDSVFVERLSDLYDEHEYYVDDDPIHVGGTPI